jgi:hypothetical protein
MIPKIKKTTPKDKKIIMVDLTFGYGCLKLYKILVKFY